METSPVFVDNRQESVLLTEKKKRTLCLVGKKKCFFLQFFYSEGLNMHFKKRKFNRKLCCRVFKGLQVNI